MKTNHFGGNLNLLPVSKKKVQIMEKKETLKKVQIMEGKNFTNEYKMWKDFT